RLHFSPYTTLFRSWVEIARNGMLKILGRSDATLNRHGVRIGTAEIYQVINNFDQIEDSLVVNLELTSGEHYMPIFIKMIPGQELTDDLIRAVSQKLRTACSPRHVPDRFIQVDGIPYTISGKKMEAPVKKILLGKDLHGSLSPDAMRNPDSLEIYQKMAERERFTRR